MREIGYDGRMAKLLYGAGNPDIRYVTGHVFSDPVFVLDMGKKQHLFLDGRELEMVKKENKIRTLKVESIYPFIEKARKIQAKTSGRNKVAISILKSFHVKKAEVSEDFPVDTADFLRKNKISLKIVPELYPERRMKTQKEAKILQGILKRMHRAFKRVEEILRDSKIQGNTILYQGKLLTSEFLKKEIDLVFMENGLVRAGENIVSSGTQSTIPHHHGEGKILPYVPIVVDLFPKDEKTGYFGDMTRTYVKGKPKKEILDMYNAVVEAQRQAFKRIKAGANANTVHEACLNVFHTKGFKTEKGEGFTHATGHGLGLEIHEMPAMAHRAEPLEEGNVVTVEPGLYYRKLGGIRIEDVVLVTKKGYKNLTRYPKRFIIS